MECMISDWRETEDIGTRNETGMWTVYFSILSMLNLSGFIREYPCFRKYILNIKRSRNMIYTTYSSNGSKKFIYI